MTALGPQTEKESRFTFEPQMNTSKPNKPAWDATIKRKESPNKRKLESIMHDDESNVKDLNFKPNIKVKSKFKNVQSKFMDTSKRVDKLRNHAYLRLKEMQLRSGQRCPAIVAVSVDGDDTGSIRQQDQTKNAVNTNNKQQKPA